MSTNDDNTKTAVAIATMQRDIAFMSTNVSEMKALLSVFVTKQELAASMKEVEGLVYKFDSRAMNSIKDIDVKIENQLGPIIEDMDNRKKDRKTMSWYVIAALIAGVFNLAFTIAKDLLYK